jgi:hypothetical protein
MPRPLPRVALWAAVVVVGASACVAPEGPAIALHTLASPLTGPCPEGTGQGEFGDEIAGLAATVTGPDIESPIQAEGVGSVRLEGVPAGPARVIALYGMGGTAPTWRGVSAPTEIKSGEETPVDILLAKIAQFSCARSSAGDARLFHTATLLDDGTVLIVGGAKELRDASAGGTCPGCRAADATDDVVVYDPKTGAFTPVGSLAAARMFHTAVKLDDGRVVIAGGTRSIATHVPSLDARFPFPIVPTAPLASVELYDPQARSFTSIGDDPNGARVFASATRLLSGEAIITGGIPAAGTPHNLGNALATSTICRDRCQNGPPLAAPRAGHHSFGLGDDGVILWGGSVGAGNGFKFEQLALGAATFEHIDVCDMNTARNVFFASGASYAQGEFLSAGGLAREADGSFHAVVDADAEGSAVFLYDINITGLDGCRTGISAGPRENRLNLTGNRFLGAAAPLPGGQRVLIAGGFEIPDDFNDVDFTPVSTVDMFVKTETQEGSQVIVTLAMDNRALSTAGVIPTLRDARGGLTATGLGDGTVVLVGGAAADGPLATAEVFADPKTPPQAAELSR